MARVTLYSGDYILMLALAGMCLLVALNWSDYDTCKDPLNVWLVVDLLSFMVFRVMQFSFQYAITGDRRQWSARELPRILAMINLYLLYPFIWVWCVLGTIWYSRSRECLTSSTQKWWFVAWLVYNFIYLLAFLVLVCTTLRLRRQAVRELRSLEQIQAFLNEYRRAEAFGLAERTGLTQEQVDSIPLCAAPADGTTAAPVTCSVCLNDVPIGSQIRNIPCKHVFHKECLDPWLAVRDSCPNCVQRVVVADAALLA